MSDFVLDMGSIEDNDFDLIPNGWYKVCVTNYSGEYANGNPVIIKKDGGKIPKGVTGTNWEFTMVEEYAKRKLWTSYWHHPKTASFWKQLYKASGEFTEAELLEPMDILAERDRVMGTEMWAQIKIQRSPGYDAQNVIRKLKPIGEHTKDISDSDNPLAP